MPRSPNVVVVVADCVGRGFLPEDGAGTDLPFLRALRSEVAVFPRAASVSHWTLPSHASLFTGRYPWEHGLYRGGRPRLDPTTPLLARTLRRHGYRTASFAANGLLNPGPGWLDGFGYAAWGSSAYLRSSRDARPPHQQSVPDPPSPARELARADAWQRATYWGVVGLERFPWLLDRVARIERRVRGPPDGGRPKLAAWIEPAFDRWVRGTPGAEPLFAFVNLMDAHEPYLLDREDGLSDAAFAASARIRQDHHGWIAGRWHPTPGESTLLEALYRATIRDLDRRIAALVGSLRRAGRWEDTLFVLTSDHGQSFGRDGGLYHMTGLSDALLRVPLWVRWPDARGAGGVARGWASLVDIAPTVGELVGAGDPLGGSVELGRLLSSDRDGPVLALGDGPTFGDSARHIAPGRRRSDPRAVAGYLGGWKAVLPLGAGSPTFTPVEPVADGTTEPDGRTARRLGAAVADVAERLAAPGRPEPPSSAEARLRAWGYAD